MGSVADCGSCERLKALERRLDLQVVILLLDSLMRRITVALIRILAVIVIVLLAPYGILGRRRFRACTVTLPVAGISLQSS